MSSKLKNNRKQEESLCTAVKQFFGYLLDGMISICMLLIIVVMPFYNEEGFSHIGTDKAMFFRRISVTGAKFILPTLALYLLCWIVENHQSIIAAVKNAKPLKEKATELWQACEKRLSLTDLFAILYTVSLLLSYAFSEYKEQGEWGSALWGSQGWFMGLLPQLFLMGIYFLVSRFWKCRSWMFLLFLPVSAVVFVLGYLNRFGIYPIDMQVENPDFISTIGNINWYCGYLVSVFFAGYYLLWQWNTEWRESDRKQRIQKILLMTYMTIGFATLVTHGSMSGILALAVVVLLTFCLSVNDSRRMTLFWQGMLLLSSACLGTWCVRKLGGVITYGDSIVNLLTNSIVPFLMVIISLLFLYGLPYYQEKFQEKKGEYPIELYRRLRKIILWGILGMLGIWAFMTLLNTIWPGILGPLSQNTYFTFSSGWGSGRGATWMAGVMCFNEQNLLHKFIGVGPDAMEAFLTYHASGEVLAMVQEYFGDLRLTNAHCEWLTILVNVGWLGFTGYVGMMVSAIMRYLQIGVTGRTAKGAVKSEIEVSKLIVGACGFSLLAYTVNNMVSFQQSMGVATIFIILGIGEAYARAYASFRFFNSENRQE